MLICREYAQEGKSPLVMIVGDNKTYRKLFPDTFIHQLKVKVIE